jgi:small GTP-binding protein
MFSRLAEDRFNLVVVGRFNRGKTSLMNVLLGTDRLPTGIVPLTSVITAVSYGTREQVFIEYEGSRYLSSCIPIDQLPEYITQQGNPANQKKVAVASIQLPCELLRRGFHFVDTPGLGSAIRENTLTTERFLPEADAFIVVSSYDSPLADEEMALLRRIVPTATKIFFVLNKHDTVSPTERDQVLRYVQQRLADAFGADAPRLYSLSALDSLKAKARDAGEDFASSGIPELLDHLVHFLIAEKSQRFLANSGERVAAILRELPNSAAPMARLAALRQRGFINGQIPVGADAPDGAGTPPFSACAICDQIERDVFAFLASYQYDIVVDDNARTELAERGGLCAFHTWQYHALASPQGTSLGFSGVLDRLAVRLREIAESSSDPCQIDALIVSDQECCVCRRRREAEQKSVSDMADRLAGGEAAVPAMPSLCLPHVRLLVRKLGKIDIARRMLAQEAAVCERISEDMRRYALKFDGMRRHLLSEEDYAAAKMALTLLAGSYNVNAARKLQ